MDLSCHHTPDYNSGTARMFGQPIIQFIHFLKSKVAAPTFWVCSALTSAYAEAKPAMSGSWSVNSVMPCSKEKVKVDRKLVLPANGIKRIMSKSYIKDERRSVIGGSDDAPHKPTSLPDQGGHLINNWSTPGPSPGTQSCQPHPPPGPPPPPPSARATAPRDYWPPPPRCGWRSAGRGPGMLSVEQAQVLAIYSSRASKQFFDSQ